MADCGPLRGCVFAERLAGSAVESTVTEELAPVRCGAVRIRAGRPTAPQRQRFRSSGQHLNVGTCSMKVCVSIVICTKNRAEYLRATLDALAGVAHFRICPRGLGDQQWGNRQHPRNCCSVQLPNMPVRYREFHNLAVPGDQHCDTGSRRRHHPAHGRRRWPPADWIERMCRPIANGTAMRLRGHRMALVLPALDGRIAPELAAGIRLFERCLPRRDDRSQHRHSADCSAARLRRRAWSGGTRVLRRRSVSRGKLRLQGLNLVGRR